MPQPLSSRLARCTLIALMAVGLAVIPACGGGGHGFRGDIADLAITNAVLPQLSSGQFVDYEIPTAGGCGGPYVIQIVQGNLPDGLTVENRVKNDGTNGVFLTGYLLVAGTFNWTFQITDTACDPFQSIVQNFSWSVGIGPLVIVDVDVGTIAEGDFNDPNKWTAGPGEDPIDAIPSTVYNQFVAFNYIVAGGNGPYTCEVIDDINDPNDGLYPLGISEAANSCSVVGSPVQVKAGGIPFLLTIRVTDSTGATAQRKFQWKIDTPPIVLPLEDLPDGEAGQLLNEIVQVVDGVPPFNFELISTMGEEDFELHNYASPAVPTFPTTSVTVQSSGVSDQRLTAAGYPTPADVGPYTGGHPSEGLFMVDTGPSAGTITGTPRRVGNFNVYVHVYSQLVPNERGQHGFKNFNHDIAPASDTGSFIGTFTDEGDPVATAAPYNTIPEFEVGAVYNPDSASDATAGLLLIGTGAVPFDGHNDAPHSTQRFANNETVGDYRWDLNFHPITGEADPAEIQLLISKTDAYSNSYFEGRLGVPTGNEGNLERSSRKLVDITFCDEQLPTSAQNCVSGRFGYSVGPDKVLLVASETNFTGTTTSNSAQFGLNDAEQEIRKFQVIGGTGVISDLDDSDLTDTHVIPAGVAASLTDNMALGELLSDAAGEPLDLMRISINPTWYAHDMHGLNPNGGRAGQHADYNRGRAWMASEYRSHGGWQPNVAAVNLPNAPGVTEDRPNGVFTDGGRLYAFETANYTGFFIIRSDASIYIPWAEDKSTWGSMGDAMIDARANGNNTLFRMVPISISPDGRFGACEVHTTIPNGSANNHTQASNSAIIVFSLCGEKVFGGSTFREIDGGAGAVVSPTGNEYLFSSSITLTNDEIHYLIGCYGNTWGSWRDHFIMKADIFAGGGGLASGVGGNWTQTSTTPMQTPYHKNDTPTTSGSTFTSGPPSGFITVTFPNDNMYLFDGTNWQENSQAPMPFRVNADGDHVAVLAGARTTGSTGSDSMQHHIWVSANGADFRQASTARRWSPMGSGRGYSFGRGPASYRHWGSYTGPSPHMEISDDGSRVAWVAYTNNGSTTSTTSSSRYAGAPSEVFAASTTNGWTSATEVDITTLRFAGSQIWRFGSLIFTKDNDGLIFFGGFSTENPTSSSTATSYTGFQEGTFYSWNFGTSTLRSILSRGEGGSPDGKATYNTTTATVTLPTTNYAGSPGYIRPMGGFVSKNRDFAYVTSQGPQGVGVLGNGTNLQTNMNLIGINISTLGAGSINGRTNGEAFVVGNQPNRRGFIPSYDYYPHEALDFRYQAPGRAAGNGREVMAKDTGWVYWTGHYQRSGPTNATSTSFGVASGPDSPVFWGDYGAWGGKVFGMNAEVGGDAHELSHITGDTVSRSIHFLDVTDDGTRLAAVYDDGGTTTGHDDERVLYIHSIGFDAATGALDPNFNRTTMSSLMETSDGRAGEGFGHGSQGRRLYYAYRSGTSGNEDEKHLVVAFRDPTDTIIKTTYQTGADRRWFSVLFAGR